MQNINLVIEIFFLGLPYLYRDALKEVVLAYVLQVPWTFFAMHVELCKSR